MFTIVQAFVRHIRLFGCLYVLVPSNVYYPHGQAWAMEIHGRFKEVTAHRAKPTSEYNTAGADRTPISKVFK